MLYGDLVTLTRGGIQLGSKAMLPVGIFDKSVCWGVWVPDASLKGVKEDQSPHLVVSSLHPRYWPYLLRFELKLNDEVGAMGKAAEVFQFHGLNILSGDSSPSGHHHATWNVVCEAVEVRRAFEEQIEGLHRRKKGVDREEIVSLATKLASRMYRTAYEVRKTMNESPGFLHPRIRTREPVLLHRVRDMDDKHARGLARMDTPAAVRVRWIQNLPVFAFYGTNTSDPYVFKYDRARSMLRPVEKDGFKKVVEKAGILEPLTKAIASIYPEEHHVRLIPIRSKEQLEQWVEVEFSYQAKFSGTWEESSSTSGGTTMGLWADVCRKLTDSKIDLQRVTNKIVHHEPNSEEGVLTLVGRNKDAPLVRSDLDHLRNTLRELPVKDGRTLFPAPKISRLTLETVFISRRMNSHGAELLTEVAEERARFWGLQPVVVGNQGRETLTQVVTRTIGQCAAFLQIITESKEEFLNRQKGGKGKGTPELHWIWYEYGVAAGHNLPVARMVDEAVMPLEKWKQKLRVGIDDILEEFNLLEYNELRDRFDKSLRMLAQQVYGGSGDD